MIFENFKCRRIVFCDFFKYAKLLGIYIYIYFTFLAIDVLFILFIYFEIFTDLRYLIYMNPFKLITKFKKNQQQ